MGAPSRYELGAAELAAELERTRAALARLEQLQLVTAALSAALRPAEVADIVVARGCDILGARHGSLALVDGEGLGVHLLGDHGLEPRSAPSPGWIPLDADEPIVEAVRAGVPVVVGPQVCIPLILVDAVLGALAFEFPAGHVVADETTSLAVALAEQAALALERAGVAEAFHEAARIRDEFLSVASHELRTPLAAALLQVDAVRRTCATHAGCLRHPGLDERLTRAKTSLERLGVLIGDLLDVSRITAGRLSLADEPLDLSEAVRESAARMHDAARRAGSTLAIDVEPGVACRGDRLRVEQVVTNLVGNAIKYGERKPVAVSLRRSGDRALLTVSDQGIGVAAGDRQRIFEKFERAANARHVGGLGLGLWITREIVEAAGGTVSVESVLGAGSSFTVELPLRGAAEQD